MTFSFPFQHLAEGSRIHSQLQSSLILLAKTKEKYEKAFGASERALDAYKKADEDLNLSRAEVEKQRMNSTIKTQQCEDAKNEYANQLQKTNEWQVRTQEECERQTRGGRTAEPGRRIFTFNRSLPSFAEQVLQPPFADGVPKPPGLGREAHQVHSELHAEGDTN